jgi:hypothetical protein
MNGLTAEQNDYLEKLLLQPPADWPQALQTTAARACQEVQASYLVIRAIAAAWILDGRNRIISVREIIALQPQADLRPSMS